MHKIVLAITLTLITSTASASWSVVPGTPLLLDNINPMPGTSFVAYDYKVSGIDAIIHRLTNCTTDDSIDQYSDGSVIIMPHVQNSNGSKANLLACMAADVYNKLTM